MHIYFDEKMAKVTILKSYLKLSDSIMRFLHTFVYLFWQNLPRHQAPNFLITFNYLWIKINSVIHI